jgi:hypothetical protein
MPTGQNYATNVPQTTLTGLINPTAPVCSVFSSSGWPATPFTAIFDIGTSSQEPVDVTNITGTTWTITRAIDGTVGMTHGVGATITHGDIGRDFHEMRAHIDASTSNDGTGHSVHGLTASSSVVGTTDIQTLTNKTISAATFTGNQTLGSGTWTGTGGLAEQTLTFTGQTGANASLTQFAGTVAAGPPTSGTFITGAVVYDTAYLGQWLCTSGGTPGTWIPITRMLLATNTPTTNTTAFGSIPQGFTHLVIEYNARTSNAGANIDYITMQLNGDSTSSYSWRAFGARQTSLAAPVSFLDGSTGLNTSMNCGMVWTSKLSNAASGRGVIELPYYTDTSFWKEMLFRSSAGDGTNDALTVSGGGMRNSTPAAAITSITILTAAGNFLTGSTFKLYGLP